MEYDKIAAVIAATMKTIREDVALGSGPEIEPDAVVMHVASGLVELFAADPAFDRDRFEQLADVLDPIPSEAFRSW